MRGYALATLAAIGALATGCGVAAGSEDDGLGEESDLPATVTCSALYRPDAEQAVGEERETLTVTRSGEPLGAMESAEFAEMTLAVTYIGEAPEGRTVTTVVTDPSGAELARTLYQIGDPALQNIEFAGGHGFTGLNYVTHGEAMLQFWCEAGEGTA